MFRLALAALFSLFCVLTFALPMPADAATSTASKKRPTKKAVVAKATKARAAKRGRTGARPTRAKSTKAAKSVRSTRSGKTITASNKAIKSQAAGKREKVVRKVVVSNGKRRVVYKREPVQVVPAVPPVLSAGDLAGLHLTHDALDLASNVALVVDQTTSRVLFEKNAKVALPIASITKLMTGLVVVEARQNMDEVLSVTDEDIDREKHSGSRLRVGSRLSRDHMLRIALMSSENRAASALGRHYPGGLTAFVAAMNAKAKALGMTDTRFVDPTGLSSQNVASAQDLVKLVRAAHRHAVLGRYSTDERYVVHPGSYSVQYANSNGLVLDKNWEIGLQKTGYISEAGRCLAMQARIEGRPVIMVFLDSKGKYTRLADAGRVRKWLATQPSQNQADRQVVAATPKT